MGAGSSFFHGNTSYEDGVLHLKVESKVHSRLEFIYLVLPLFLVLRLR